MGLAVAKKVLTCGAEVVIAGRSEERLLAARMSLGEDRVEIASMDIGERSQVAAMFAQVGRFDHLVVTAADLPYGPVLELTESDLMRAVRSKYLGLVFAIQESAMLIKPGGSITFTSGIAAHRPMRGGSTAAAINCGVEGLVRALAVELAPLRVNAVSPGWVDTPIWGRIMNTERKAETFAAMADRLPVGRIGHAEDIAEAVIYLMNSRYSTGTILKIDGGHALV
jgi:NAD(P)-dependent dehydrogenase (short-subunit alcohol dehydrogenase family)